MNRNILPIMDRFGINWNSVPFQLHRRIVYNPILTKNNQQKSQTNFTEWNLTQEKWNRNVITTLQPIRKQTEIRQVQIQAKSSIQNNIGQLNKNHNWISLCVSCNLLKHFVSARELACKKWIHSCIRIGVGDFKIEKSKGFQDC